MFALRKQLVRNILPFAFLFAACTQDEVVTDSASGEVTNADMPVRVEVGLNDFATTGQPSTKIYTYPDSGLEEFENGDEIGLWFIANNYANPEYSHVIGDMYTLTYNNGKWDGELPTWGDLMPYVQESVHVAVKACYPKPVESSDDALFAIEVPADQSLLDADGFRNLTHQLSNVTTYYNIIPEGGVIDLGFRYGMDRLKIILRGEPDVVANTQIALPGRYMKASCYVMDVNQYVSSDGATIIPWRADAEQSEGEAVYYALIPQCNLFFTLDVLLTYNGNESRHQVEMNYALGQGGVDYTVILNLKRGE